MDDYFIYYGEFCEHKKEKFAVVIVAITGWAAATILIIVILRCLYKRKHWKKEKENVFV